MSINSCCDKDIQRDLLRSKRDLLGSKRDLLNSCCDKDIPGRVQRKAPVTKETYYSVKRDLPDTARKVTQETYYSGERLSLIASLRREER